MPWLRHNTLQKSHGTTGTITVLYRRCTHHLPSRGSSVPWEGSGTGKWLFMALPKTGPSPAPDLPRFPSQYGSREVTVTLWHSSKGCWYQPKICEDNCWCQELYCSFCSAQCLRLDSIGEPPRGMAETSTVWIQLNILPHPKRTERKIQLLCPENAFPFSWLEADQGSPGIVNIWATLFFYTKLSPSLKPNILLSWTF